ncbi:tudor domain-containing protein 7B-like [Salmo trutta]|uniref:tudor domain-containing protein 7B-like n=1 Tax=Salmo trutta TaxID=8032 RepID=UPI001130B5D1|nr:tudor domain-containing protein 7B-like [Salmo trutta]
MHNQDLPGQAVIDLENWTHICSVEKPVSTNRADRLVYPPSTQTPQPCCRTSQTPNGPLYCQTSHNPPSQIHPYRSSQTSHRQPSETGPSLLLTAEPLLEPESDFAHSTGPLVEELPDPYPHLSNCPLFLVEALSFPPTPYTHLSFVETLPYVLLALMEAHNYLFLPYSPHLPNSSLPHLPHMDGLPYPPSPLQR